MKALYFDCFSGISGDMTIGALLDLGLDFEYLKAELKKLPVEDYELKVSRVVRSNLSATKFDVVIPSASGRGQGDGHNHEHHHHDDHAHSHFHRKASEILSMIRGSSLSLGSKRFATDIFTKLATSEGKVHDVQPEDVEFHEVGAIDSIVDTVGTAIGFDALGVERFFCSAINIGSGFIHCQHGIMPVPAPATADLLRHATVYQKHAQTELVTPTGAAILAAVVNQFGPMQGFAAERIGYGAGTKQFPDFPNCLRLMLGDERGVTAQRLSGDVIVIEANIDDMTAQNFGYVTETLLAAGALDVFTVPIQMKKGRPGHLLQVLAPQEAADSLSRIIFRETTTIGIRRHAVDRTTLEREFVEVDTTYGKVKIKVSRLDGEVVTAAPEYEDCARIAREKDVPLKQIQALALNSYLSRSKKE
ncbi:MAG TPA: nickel pincer cofactor biosynthesis protein LarC [Terriglobia bacterium]|nr:nickel pincer cofactor biosynthesis protein LarC [Terriglobia bacterium]